MDTAILGCHLQKRMLRGYLKSKNLQKIDTEMASTARGSYPIALWFQEFINLEKSVCALENIIKSDASFFTNEAVRFNLLAPEFYI
jgi:hypothetical protein